MKKFVGAKGQAGLFQKILNLIPPHRVFLEPFAGLATVARKKRPAEKTLLIDRAQNPALILPAGAEFITGDGVEFLASYPWRGDEFVFADPPYLPETIAGRRYYSHIMTAEDHARLLAVLRGLPVPVLLCGYRSALYDAELATWHRDDVRVMTRAHTWRTECLWRNYERPAVLHEFSAVGEDYRARWNLKRCRRRWAARLQRMPAAERSALFAALVDVMEPDAARRIMASAAPAAGDRPGVTVAKLVTSAAIGARPGEVTRPASRWRISQR